MRDLIRKYLRSKGYDIQKLDKPYKEFKNLSTDNNYDYFETPIGNYYTPKGIKKDVIANKMKAGELFEPEVVDIAKKYIKPNTAVLDIGSNFGQMAIEFAKQLNGTGRVYCFEAQKPVFDILVKNIEANNLKNVIPNYSAVYNKSNETMYFPEPDFAIFSTYGSFGLDPNSKKGNEVKSITIDSMSFDFPISFMKIDIQGADLAALEGAIETIQKHKMPILFEFEQEFQAKFNTSFQQYVDFVKKINYRFEETILDINYLILPNE